MSCSRSLADKEQGQNSNSLLVSEPRVFFYHNVYVMYAHPSPSHFPCSSRQVIIASDFFLAFSLDSFCTRAEGQEVFRTREGRILDTPRSTGSFYAAGSCEPGWGFVGSR